MGTPLQRTIKAVVVRPGEEWGYVAECVEIPVVTQGATLDEVTENLREAVALHLEGEDLARGSHRRIRILTQSDCPRA